MPSTLYVWPLDRRPRDAAGRHGSLHVKCAVADETTALISSANLTEHALHHRPCPQRARMTVARGS